VRRSRRSAERAEEESVYVSMTDMMVGVVFIFILLLSYFGLQYHATTQALTQADDPKTAALLQSGLSLKPRTIAAQIDPSRQVLCVPESALLPSEPGDPARGEQRCFAFSTSATGAPAAPQPSVEENRLAFMSFLTSDLSGSTGPATADAEGGVIGYAADRLFEPDSDVLSQEGIRDSARLADALAARLPCYGYAVVAKACDTPQKMAAVNIVGETRFNAFTAEGQHAWDLSLKRTVAFYRALIARQPILGAVRDAPASTPGAEPLLRVASGGQSRAADTSGGADQSIGVQFVLRP
jgi:hypothetical protein